MNSGVNLLPDTMRRAAVRRPILRRWAWSFLILTGCLGTRAVNQWQTCQKLRIESMALQPLATEVEIQLQQISELEQRITQQQLDLANVDPGSAKSAVLPLLKVVTDRARRFESSLTINAIELDHTAPTDTNQSDSAQGPEMRLSLSGDAESEIVIERLVAEYVESGVFSDVRLTESKEDSTSSPLRQMFVVECRRRQVR